jgi:hypothetical protein
MHRQILQLMVILTVGTTSAVASAEWGTLEQARLCEKDWATANASPKREDWIADAMKTGKGIAPACKAEIDREAQLCLKDPGLDLELRQRGLKASDGNRYCIVHVFFNMADQFENADRKAKEAEEEAKKQEERKAKDAAEVAARELPKAERKDAKLEKAVADAYHRDYPSGKILKVILGSWSTDYEKDDFGRVIGRDIDATVVNKQQDGKCYLHDELWMQHGNGRSFSGPLSARGAGSASDKEILCTKAEAAGGAVAAKGGKKK